MQNLKLKTYGNIIVGEHRTEKVYVEISYGTLLSLTQHMALPKNKGTCHLPLIESYVLVFSKQLALTTNGSRLVNYPSK